MSKAAEYVGLAGMPYNLRLKWERFLRGGWTKEEPLEEGVYLFDDGPARVRLGSGGGQDWMYAPLGSSWEGSLGKRWRWSVPIPEWPSPYAASLP